ncbi:hypothetical protein [Microbacterium sp. C7(2022)]|uniref:hypothetical protein n=1 Tax=Microbacterium sp. C7(2022) TaxID=2992759 RepID=UPI00237B428F|nr:hypothetical protein [Microbacterium sp. C7(2022)]MDE0545409.1 hypothetical protein [Microbacterium sp. C7(2022)]
MTHRMPRAAVALALIAVAGVSLTACSLDSLIWGADGAHVISTTEQLIDAASAGDGAAFACDGAEVEWGESAAWSGLSAEEPEKFVAEHWPEQAEDDPSWSINLSLPFERVESATRFPGDVFYRDEAGELCVVDVAWATVIR